MGAVRATGAGYLRSSRRRVRQAHPPADAAAPERAGHHDHPGPARQRHHRAVPPGCALRPSAVAALTDGRSSGGFTPQATGAARHANAPEASVW